MQCLSTVRGAIISGWYWVSYQFAMTRLGVSEAFIRQAFSALTELDLDEFRYIPQLCLELKAWGNEVHIKIREDWLAEEEKYSLDDEDYSYQCVIKEGIKGRVYVDEWREEEREVTLEYGARHKTHWWEVYRTGKWIRSARFVDYLKLLYGEGNYAVQKQSPAGLDVRSRQTTSGEGVRSEAAGPEESAAGAGAKADELREPDSLPGPGQT